MSITQVELATDYEQARPRLVRIAYAIVGTLAEAEDVTAECWFTLVSTHAREPVLNVQAWATVVVARRALDTLRTARVRRETYVGPWLPEPRVAPDTDAQDPADRVTLQESVSFALLVVLETLTPAERTTWVLHHVFGLPLTEVAVVVGRSPAAVRQLAHRARRHVVDGAPRWHADARTHREVVHAFGRAAAGGDLSRLLEVLDPDVVLTADGGGRVTAARRPVTGRDRVGRMILGFMSKGTARSVMSVLVNDAPGLAFLDSGQMFFIASCSVDDGVITRLDLVVTPEKLPILVPNGNLVAASATHQQRAHYLYAAAPPGDWTARPVGTGAST